MGQKLKDNVDNSKINDKQSNVDSLKGQANVQRRLNSNPCVIHVARVRYLKKVGTVASWNVNNERHLAGVCFDTCQSVQLAALVRCAAFGAEKKDFVFGLDEKIGTLFYSSNSAPFFSLKQFTPSCLLLVP